MNRIEGQNNGINDNKSNISRRVKSGILAAGIMLGGVGIGTVNEARAEIIPGEMPSQKGSVLDQLEKSMAEAESWPTIEGTTFKDGVYYYEKDNIYGGKEGELAGMVKPEVYVEGEKIGGVCFKPEVCKVMLENAYAKIPEGEPNLTGIVPLDISNYDGSVKIDNGSFFSDYSKKNLYGVKIECFDDVGILNTHLGASWWGSGETIVNGHPAILFSDLLVLPKDIEEKPSFAFSHAYVLFWTYVLVGGDLLESKEVINPNGVGFGEKIGYKGVNDILYLVCKNSKVREKFGSPEIKDCLTIENKMVFMIPSETTTIVEPRVESSQYKTINVGYKGKEVADLKQRMYELGYFKTNTVNENFTESTKKYVEEFEKANGLLVDGIADPEMQALFFSDKAIRKP